MRDCALIMSCIPVAVRTKWVTASARQARFFRLLRQRAAIETWQRHLVDGLACGPWSHGDSLRNERGPCGRCQCI